MIIDVKNIVKTYKTTKAVDDVSFSIKEGEIFGFLGPNGAGKSTIIKILTSRLSLTSGSVMVAGLNPSKDREKLHNIIGVVPEIQNLYERMTARENLNLFAKLYKADTKKVNELLERFELSERADDKLKNFSFGMKQRILLARGLLASPKIIFMDEPTKGLDPHTARYIREIIKEENNKGVTIFLTTHYMEEAESLSDRVAILDKGKIVALDSPQNLTRSSDNLLKVILRNNETINLSLENENDRDKLQLLTKNNEILSMESQKESLEDVFVKLTGRKLV